MNRIIMFVYTLVALLAFSGDAYAVCQAGETAVYFPNNLTVCAPFSTHADGENHRFALATNIYAHTVAVDYESRRRGLGEFGIFYWWEDYDFHWATDCPNTIWNEGEICWKFSSFEEVALHWHFGLLHLLELQAYLAYLQNMPLLEAKSCNSFSSVNVYKPAAETRGGAVFVADGGKYCPSDKTITNKMLPSDIYLSDSLGRRIASGNLRHCNKENQGRLHFDLPRGSGSAFLQIAWEDKPNECFYISDRAKRHS